MALSGLTSVFADEEDDTEEQQVEFASGDQEYSDELLHQLLNGELEETAEEPLADRGGDEHGAWTDESTLTASDAGYQDDFDISRLMDLEAELGEQNASVPNSQDIMMVSADDFSPGEDLFVIEYDPSAGNPEVELFGDPSGNSLVYCNGECVLVMKGGDGILDHGDIELSPLS